MSDSQKRQSTLDAGRAVLAAEREALDAVLSRMGEPFVQAVDILAGNEGKVVLAGVGKSGHICQKIAATFCSTGQPSVFMHAGEAMHGDLGIYRPGDPTILVSKSGSTLELLRIAPVLRQFESPLIALVGNTSSALAELADVVLDASVAREADPLGIVPTSSALVTLAIGDALACALMKQRGFIEEDFARYHPAGQLGRNLMLHVSDVMHKREVVALLSPDDTLREAVIRMSEYPLGAACVMEQERFIGILTDGDIRRGLRDFEDFNQVTVSSLMTRNPISVPPEATLADATRLMEDRPSQISVLPVLSAPGVLAGLIRIHDIYQPNLY